MNRYSLPIATILLTLVFRPLLAATPGVTTLSDPSIRFAVPAKPYVVLERGGVRAVIVDNQPVDDEVLPGHRAGYSGVASLAHEKRAANLFVPAYAGLNFEHIHDGTTRERDVLFEPRVAPMQLRSIDAHTAELYQPPTPTWALESCHRYQLLDDGTIEMTFHCIPRKRTFRNRYIGLFWASYIHQPPSLDIHFIGRPDGEPNVEPRWVRGVTPEHGVLPTHLAADDDRQFAHDGDFPLSLVFNRSQFRYIEPWYFGVSGNMAMAMIFRRADVIRFSQSPSGGGGGNPAWDFQFFIPDYQVNQQYGFIMRAVYAPYESAEQMAETVKPHLRMLNAEQ